MKEQFLEFCGSIDKKTRHQQLLFRFRWPRQLPFLFFFFFLIVNNLLVKNLRYRYEAEINYFRNINSVMFIYCIRYTQSEVSQKDKDHYSMLYMEFRKMLMITLYAKQKKRHRCIEQCFGLCGRRRGWDVSREQHRNIYIIQGETDHQPRLDA